LSCPKCSNTTFETDRFHAAGGLWAKIFDIQNKVFATVSCTHCGYTETYKGTTTTLSNVFDLFTN
jgi:predicted nucleic-acid-binding Zn-ribbon protein